MHYDFSVITKVFGVCILLEKSRRGYKQKCKVVSLNLSHPVHPCESM